MSLNRFTVGGGLTFDITMTITTRDTSRLSNRSLLFGALTGPIAWTAFFIVGYLIAEGACEANLLQSRAAGLTMVALVVILLAVPAFLISLYATIKTYRYWQSLGENDTATEGVREFLVYGGTLLNAVFTLAIIVTALPLFFVETCSWI